MNQQELDELKNRFTNQPCICRRHESCNTCEPNPNRVETIIIKLIAEVESLNIQKQILIAAMYEAVNNEDGDWEFMNFVLRKAIKECQ